MAPLKAFRVNICKPIYLSANGTFTDSTGGDFDWRDITYYIKDVNIEMVDLSKKYQVFVEHLTLHNFTTASTPFVIDSPSLVDPSAFHTDEVNSTGAILTHGHFAQTDYHAAITTEDIGIPVSLDFLRRRQIQIRLRALANTAFDAASQTTTTLQGETALGDSAYYQLTLLFTQVPQSLQ